MQDAPHALCFETGPDCLQAMKIPLLRGRFFTPADTSESEPVVVIDSVLAQTYFAGKDRLGQIITVAHCARDRRRGPCAALAGLGDPGTYNPSQIYIFFSQLPDPWTSAFAKELSIAVRTPLDAAAIVPGIKDAIYGAGKDRPIDDVPTMQQIVSDSMAWQRRTMILLGAFAALALVLAAVGSYGVSSYSVNQRVQEIGIRMALGADRGNVLRTLIGQGLGLAIAGAVAGAVAALALARLLASFLQLHYGVTASDPATFLTVSFVLMSTAALACYIPARRATRIDPMQALRSE
jgi:hypothetical protein